MEQPILSNLGNNLIKQSRTLIPHSDVVTLPSIGVNLVGAPGTGRFLYFIGALLYPTLIEPYTNVDDDGINMSIKVGDKQVGMIYNDAVAGYILLDALLGSGYILSGLQLTNLLSDNGTGGFLDINPSLINSALSIKANINDPTFEGGNVGNKLLITTLYMIYDVNLGLFVI